jgi:predicted outer membrane repeat protein
MVVPSPFHLTTLRPYKGGAIRAWLSPLVFLFLFVRPLLMRFRALHHHCSANFSRNTAYGSGGAFYVENRAVATLGG